MIFTAKSQMSLVETSKITRINRGIFTDRNGRRFNNINSLRLMESIKISLVRIAFTILRRSPLRVRSLYDLARNRRFEADLFDVCA